jgi:hypothetical protein
LPPYFGNDSLPRGFEGKEEDAKPITVPNPIKPEYRPSEKIPTMPIELK